MLVDIHHHLIYGIDDGPSYFRETQQMILRACKVGVAHLIATSHAHPGVEDFPYEKYMGNLRMAQDWCLKNGLDIRLYPGSEIFYTDMTARLLDERRIPTLANSRYVLVEFSPGDNYERISGAMRTLGSVGYWPVLAHAERYECLRNIKRLRELHDDYQVIIQVNARTILTPNGFMTKRWLHKAFASDLVDIAASDAHNMDARRCRMGKCYQHLAETFGEERAQALCIDNPMQILDSVTHKQVL